LFFTASERQSLTRFLAELNAANVTVTARQVKHHFSTFQPLLNELRDTLRLRLTGGDAQFKDEELKAIIGLLAGPGVAWELKLGS